MTVAGRKSAVRKTALAQRKAAFEEALPAQSGQLSAFLAGYRGVAVAGYMPIRTEIDPLPAMAEASAYGPVCVPVIQGAGQALKFRAWEPDCPMIDGPFGAQIPERGDWVVPELVIVPLVAFDAAGQRLGYGGGYYDRTLRNLRAQQGTLAIGFAFDGQEVASVPVELTDQPLDLIITQTRVLTFTA